jgi:transposase
MAFCIRAFTPEELAAISQLAHSRTAPARLVERARMVWHASQGETILTIARRLALDARTVRTWLGRFQQQGLPGLQDRARAGRPARYTPEEVGVVIATSLTDPQSLGLPFAGWTLDRLQAYLNEVKAIPIRRSRIDEILLAEGLRWRSQETWFGARAQAPSTAPNEACPEPQRPLDPDFAEKRGRSSGFTPPRQQAA